MHWGAGSCARRQVEHLLMKSMSLGLVRAVRPPLVAHPKGPRFSTHMSARTHTRWTDAGRGGRRRRDRVGPATHPGPVADRLARDAAALLERLGLQPGHQHARRGARAVCRLERSWCLPSLRMPHPANISVRCCFIHGVQKKSRNRAGSQGRVAHIAGRGWRATRARRRGPGASSPRACRSAP